MQGCSNHALHSARVAGAMTCSPLGESGITTISCPSELIGLQDVAELTECPGEDAGDVHLGHADPLGDLGLGEVLVEAQIDNETVPLRQRLQRLVETGPIEHG